MAVFQKQGLDSVVKIEVGILRSTIVASTPTIVNNTLFLRGTIAILTWKPGINFSFSKHNDLYFRNGHKLPSDTWENTTTRSRICYVIVEIFLIRLALANWGRFLEGYVSHVYMCTLLGSFFMMAIKYLEYMV